MGLFRRESPAEKTLRSCCGIVGDAVVRVASGVMPADFEEFTLENQAQTIRDAYRQVVAESGEKAARQASVEHVRRQVSTSVHRTQPAMTGPVTDRAVALIQGIVGSNAG